MSKITCCPKCESHQISPRTGNGGANSKAGEINERWYCDDCKHRFDDPLSKPRQSKGISAEQILRDIGVDPSEAMQ